MLKWRLLWKNSTVILLRNGGSMKLDTVRLVTIRILSAILSGTSIFRHEIICFECLNSVVWSLGCLRVFLFLWPLIWVAVRWVWKASEDVCIWFNHMCSTGAIRIRYSLWIVRWMWYDKLLPMLVVFMCLPTLICGTEFAVGIWMTLLLDIDPCIAVFCWSVENQVKVFTLALIKPTARHAWDRGQSSLRPVVFRVQSLRAKSQERLKDNPCSKKLLPVVPSQGRRLLGRMCLWWKRVAVLVGQKSQRRAKEKEMKIMKSITNWKSSSPLDLFFGKYSFWSFDFGWQFF